MSQISRGGHRPPASMNVYVYTYIFDVMKIVYSILHAMRAIVCNAHERENTVSSYKIAVTFFLTNHPNKCTILEEPRTTRLDIKYAT